MLKRSLAVALLLCAVATQAAASFTYRMTGGTCTDSNHRVVQDPVTGFEVVGPKWCSDTMTVVVQLSDAYTPGTHFGESSIDIRQGAEPILEYFAFSDGANSFSSFFYAGGAYFGGSSGDLPVTEGPGALRMTMFDAVGFVSNGGLWQYGIDGGPPGCTIGSTLGDPCVLAPAYFSTGTFTGFELVVPEPTTAWLVLAGLLAAAGTRPRWRLG